MTTVFTNIIVRFVFVGLSCTHARGMRFRSSRCCCCIGTIPGGVVTGRRGIMGRFNGAKDLKGGVRERGRRGVDGRTVTGSLRVSRGVFRSSG